MRAVLVCVAVLVGCFLVGVCSTAGSWARFLAALVVVGVYGSLLWRYEHDVLEPSASDCRRCPTADCEAAIRVGCSVCPAGQTPTDKETT